jgi:quercetin dioxygenase-like cupin family protein
MSEQHDLEALGQDLLTQAAESPHGTASRAVVHGDRMRAVLIAFRPGTSLDEHDAPPAATLQVLRGRAVLVAGEDRAEVEAGALVTIPQSRHSLEVPEVETVALLTVCLG